MKIKMNELASIIYQVENEQKMNSSDISFDNLAFHRKLHYVVKAQNWIKVLNILKGIKGH